MNPAVIVIRRVGNAVYDATVRLYYAQKKTVGSSCIAGKIARFAHIATIANLCHRLVFLFANADYIYIHHPCTGCILNCSGLVSLIFKHGSTVEPRFTVTSLVRSPLH